MPEPTEQVVEKESPRSTELNLTDPLREILQERAFAVYEDYRDDLQRELATNGTLATELTAEVAAFEEADHGLEAIETQVKEAELRHEESLTALARTRDEQRATAEREHPPGPEHTNLQQVLDERAFEGFEDFPDIDDYNAWDDAQISRLFYARLQGIGCTFKKPEDALARIEAHIQERRARFEDRYAATRQFHYQVTSGILGVARLGTPECDFLSSISNNYSRDIRDSYVDGIENTAQIEALEATNQTYSTARARTEAENEAELSQIRSGADELREQRGEHLRSLGRISRDALTTILTRRRDEYDAMVEARRAQEAAQDGRSSGLASDLWHVTSATPTSIWVENIEYDPVSPFELAEIAERALTNKQGEIYETYAEDIADQEEEEDGLQPQMELLNEQFRQREAISTELSELETAVEQETATLAERRNIELEKVRAEHPDQTRHSRLDALTEPGYMDFPPLDTVGLDAEAWTPDMLGRLLYERVSDLGYDFVAERDTVLDELKRLISQHQQKYEQNLAPVKDADYLTEIVAPITGWRTLATITGDIASILRQVVKDYDQQSQLDLEYYFGANNETRIREEKRVNSDFDQQAAQLQDSIVQGRRRAQGATRDIEQEIHTTLVSIRGTILGRLQSRIEQVQAELATQREQTEEERVRLETSRAELQTKIRAVQRY